MALPDKLRREEFLARLPQLRALVVGDLMLDEYIFGGAERISPEAPVPVVDVRRVELRLGGAGNVVNNLLALGCRVEVGGVIGCDDDGERLQQALSAAGAGCERLIVETERMTTRKTRLIAAGQQMLRIDREVRNPIRSQSEAALLQAITARIDDFDVLFLSDYQKGVLSQTLTAALITAARAAGVPVVIDPKGNEYDKYRGATVLTPNRRELALAVGRTLTDEAALGSAAADLIGRLGLDGLLVTRSEEGMSLYTPDGSECRLPTVAREVFDVSGAGDTVLALFGAGIAAGLDFPDAAALANLGAGIVVGKIGTSTVSAGELAAALDSESVDRKIHDRTILAKILAAARQQKKTIVFTNGCFDLLHVGHVRYLQAARRLGDLLVLGLNTDASIRRLKGPNRPLISEADRAHILAALDCVDYVVLFDEETPYELIRLLKPQILVKGGDYNDKEVVGRDLVEADGGRVALIDFVDNRSTTGIVETILARYGGTGA